MDFGDLGFYLKPGLGAAVCPGFTGHVHCNFIQKLLKQELFDNGLHEIYSSCNIGIN